MSQNIETVQLSTLESVQLENTGATVRVSIVVGSVPILSRHITRAAARQLGDALGYLSNDLARGAA